MQLIDLLRDWCESTFYNVVYHPPELTPPGRSDKRAFIEVSYSYGRHPVLSIKNKKTYQIYEWGNEGKVVIFQYWVGLRSENPLRKVYDSHDPTFLEKIKLDLIEHGVDLG